MSVGAIFKLIHVYLLATVKYFLTFPYALIIGLNYTQTIIAVTIGGISGFYFFYRLSGILIEYYYKHRGAVFSAVKKYSGIDLARFMERRSSRKKPIFNKRIRIFVRFRKSYGLWGIIIATPILLSIPFGAFLLNKYYSKQKNIFAYMLISILGWALVFSTIFIILPKPV